MAFLNDIEGFPHFGGAGQGAVAGNHADVFGQPAEHLAQIGDQAIHRTAALHIHEREAAIEQQIAQVNDSRLLEPDHDIAIRVAWGQVQHHHFVAVEEQAQTFAEGDDRQLLGRRLAGDQPRPHVVVREDRPFAAKERIAAHMVAVVVGVDDIGWQAAAKPVDGGGDALGQGRELIIHHQHAVRPDADRNVAPDAFQHVDAFGHGNGLDFHIGEALPRPAERWRRCQGERRRCQSEKHGERRRSAPPEKCRLVAPRRVNSVGHRRHFASCQLPSAKPASRAEHPLFSRCQ